MMLGVGVLCGWMVVVLHAVPIRHTIDTGHTNAYDHQGFQPVTLPQHLTPDRATTEPLPSTLYHRHLNTLYAAHQRSPRSHQPLPQKKQKLRTNHKHHPPQRKLQQSSDPESTFRTHLALNATLRIKKLLDHCTDQRLPHDTDQHPEPQVPLDPHPQTHAEQRRIHTPHQHHKNTKLQHLDTRKKVIFRAKKKTSHFCPLSCVVGWLFHCVLVGA
jgi:hypothetical protein